MNIKWAESLDMQNLNLLADHRNRKEKREKLYWELFFIEQKTTTKRIKGKALKHFTELRKISWKSLHHSSLSINHSLVDLLHALSRPLYPDMYLFCVYVFSDSLSQDIVLSEIFNFFSASFEIKFQQQQRPLYAQRAKKKSLNEKEDTC